MPITPDDKNWTWVLERQCPECGFEAAIFPREQVGQLVRENAIAWPAVLARADVARRPRDDTWSPLEYACHVRDVLRIYHERLELMLTEEHPLFPNWDQDASAEDDAYGEQDPGRVAVELREAADRLAHRFDGVAGSQWSRPGRRSDGAHFTVESFARYFIHDPVHHLHDVEV
jgi:hypothetical protein